MLPPGEWIYKAFQNTRFGLIPLGAFPYYSVIRVIRHTYKRHVVDCTESNVHLLVVTSVVLPQYCLHWHCVFLTNADLSKLELY